jgi:predicted permease
VAKLIFSLGLVFFGLSMGYIVQRLVEGKRISLPLTIDALRKKLQKAALLFFNPVAILGATWIARLDDIRMIAFPFLGITALTLGGVLAFTAARMFRLNRKQTGAYIVSGGFTNIGSLGALLCFIFLGESGFALVPFYKLFEEFSYYAIGFPIAKSYSIEADERETFGGRLKKVFSDIFVLVALSSILIGLVLNFSGIPRPAFYQTINTVFIPFGALLLLISIGMAMRFSRASRFLKESLGIALIKFVLVPVTIVSIGYLIGLKQADHALPLQVVLILSSMPVGFIAMVPPTIYDLDIDLANSCWLTTNFLLIVEIPLLMFLVNYL